MSDGQWALEQLSYYRAARKPVPERVLRKIDHCYRHFTQGKPVAYRPEAGRDTPAPLTLGEAFGVPDIKGSQGAGKVALKRKRLALAEPMLVALFTGQAGKKLPRSGNGYQQAADKLGLTHSQVEDWVAKNLAQPSRKTTQ